MYRIYPLYPHSYHKIKFWGIFVKALLRREAAKLRLLAVAREAACVAAAKAQLRRLRRLGAMAEAVQAVEAARPQIIVFEDAD